MSFQPTIFSLFYHAVGSKGVVSTARDNDMIKKAYIEELRSLRNALGK